MGVTSIIFTVPAVMEGVYTGLGVGAGRSRMGDLIGYLRILPVTQGERYKVEIYIRNAGIHT